MKGHDQKYQRNPRAKNNFFDLSNDTGQNQGNRNYSFRGRIKLNLLCMTWQSEIKDNNQDNRNQNYFQRNLKHVHCIYINFTSKKAASQQRVITIAAKVERAVIVTDSAKLDRDKKTKLEAVPTGRLETKINPTEKKGGKSNTLPSSHPKKPLQ